jgi:hypothetical protein
MWECPLIGCFRDVALWVALIGFGMVSLHEFSEILRKVCRRVLSVMLALEPFVSF